MPGKVRVLDGDVFIKYSSHRCYDDHSSPLPQSVIIQKLYLMQAALRPYIGMRKNENKPTIVWRYVTYSLLTRRTTRELISCVWLEWGLLKDVSRPPFRLFLVNWSAMSWKKIICSDSLVMRIHMSQNSAYIHFVRNALKCIFYASSNWK